MTATLPNCPAVTVVDYGLGNLFSIRRALAHLGAAVEMTDDPQRIAQAQALILPGVGAFGDGMAQLRQRGLIEPLTAAARTGRPLLGICLGMQLLFDESDEFGRHEGLGLIGGRVVRLRETDLDGGRIKVPHVGWSELLPGPARASWDGTVLEPLPAGSAMYFVHSFVPQPSSETVTAAQMVYGGHRYCAVVEQDQVVGCQFHPEKSGEVGLRLLQNFLMRIDAVHKES